MTIRPALAPSRKPRRSFRRWLRQQREDLFVLAGCGLLVYGLAQISAAAAWMAAGAVFVVWGALLAYGGRK